MYLLLAVKTSRIASVFIVLEVKIVLMNIFRSCRVYQLRSYVNMWQRSIYPQTTDAVNLMSWQRKLIGSCKQRRIQDFAKGAPNQEEAHYQRVVWPNFTESCVKMRKIAPKKRHASIQNFTLDPPLVDHVWKPLDIQWRIPLQGAPTYNFAKISQTAWNWNNLDGGGDLRPKFYYVDPPLILLASELHWIWETFSRKNFVQFRRKKQITKKNKEKHTHTQIGWKKFAEDYLLGENAN